MPRRFRPVLSLLVIALLSGAGYLFHLHWMNREAARLVAFLSVPEGGVVAEIGAGKGDLALAFARCASPSIHVLATEIDESALSYLRKAVRNSNQHNIKIVRGTESSTQLDAGSCDAIFMKRVYHHFTNPEAMARSLYVSLHSGGLLAVIDSAPAGGHGIRLSLLIQELSVSGFKHVRSIENWDGRYYLALFRKE